MSKTVQGISRLAAWSLTALALGLLWIAPEVPGPVFALVWGTILVAFRFASSIAATQPGRIVIDIVFLGACLLGAWWGGWFLVPAGLAFLLHDGIQDGSRELGRSAPGPSRKGSAGGDAPETPTLAASPSRR
jgi:hypothetical protein